jgi:integrase
MPRRRNTEARVLGPIKLGDGRWRITIIDPEAIQPEHRRIVRHHGSEKEAQDDRLAIEKNWSRLHEVKIGAALELYREHLERKGTGETSYTETIRRLRLFFGDDTKRVASLTATGAGKLYEAFAVNRSVDYHRNTLAEAKTFGRWCVDQGWIKASPLESVKGFGKRRAGKSQLTGDESHRFLFAALWRAESGDLGALGCAMLLTMALRQGDVVKRRVRDVDLGGAVLRVENGKTAKSNRPRKIPLVLQPLLRELAADRSPLEPLFLAEGGGFHTKSWLRSAARRVCVAAGVEYVCPHGLKGTAGTLAIEAGALADQVADYLSHEKLSTTERHYVDAGAVVDAQQGRTLAVIQGGKR